MNILKDNVLYFIQSNSYKVLLVFAILTLAVCFTPLFFEDPGDASLDPKKEAYEVQQRINEKFVEAVQFVSFVIEADDGDMVDKESLEDLLERQNKIIDLDSKMELAVGSLEKNNFLWTGYDEVTKISFIGVYSIANLVDNFLKINPNFPNGIYDADEDDVKIAIHQIFETGLVENPFSILSKPAGYEKRTVKNIEINYWKSPAIFVDVLSDNEKMGGGNFAIELGGDETTINKERYARNLEKIMNESSPSFEALGIATDVNLVAEEQGSIAGQFVTFTVIAAIAVCGIFLRSYVAMVLVGVGLISLMIWLKGMSFVFGFKGGLITDLIVPIAMVSLGVDFSIHALKRMQEERSRGHKNYFIVGMSGVVGALTLALLTDSSAFLANAFAGVESVFYFGLAATLATLLSYIVLGILVPLSYSIVLPKIKNNRSKLENFIRIINFITTPATCGFGVIFVVILGSTLLNDFAGLIIGFATCIFILLVNLFLPIYLNSKSKIKQSKENVKGQTSYEMIFSKIVTSIAKKYYIVIPLSIAITISAGIGAINLKSEFDVKDFFDNDSNFVIALDRFEEYTPGLRGEPAQLIFEGNITSPDFISKFEEFLIEMSEVEFVGVNQDGSLNQSGTLNLSKISKLILSNEKIIEDINDKYDLLITDNDNNFIPDNQIQIETMIKYGIDNGISSDGEYSFDPLWFQRYFWYNQELDNDYTSILMVFLSGTRTEDDVSKVRNEITKLINEYNFEKDGVAVGITGSPFSRSDQLNATTDSMRRSIPYAFIASFSIILFTLRSFKYAILTVIPIALVVVWLYGIMYLFDFSLNYVTATIGAISLGVGVDFAIHMTMRFREELLRQPNKYEALSYSISGTGVALLGSAISSVIGFAIMGFAPMPLFSTFGILTAIMICLALLSSLLTLPSLLYLFSKK